MAEVCRNCIGGPGEKTPGVNLRQSQAEIVPCFVLHDALIGRVRSFVCGIVYL